MAAPQLEIVQGGGGSSPSTSKPMFKVGKFKVTKPMFYIGGALLVLALVVVSKNRQSTNVQSATIGYPDGTAMIENGVDVQAQMQQYGGLLAQDMAYTLQSYDVGVNQLLTDLRNEQSSVVADLRMENTDLKNSLESFIKDQLQQQQAKNESVTQSYQPSTPVTSTPTQHAAPVHTGDAYTTYGYDFIQSVDGYQVGFHRAGISVNGQDFILNSGDYLRQDRFKNSDGSFNEGFYNAVQTALHMRSVHDNYKDPHQIYTSPSKINGQAVDSYSYQMNDTGGMTILDVHPAGA